MAEWLRRGLQILARRFDSGSGLHLFLHFSSEASPAAGAPSLAVESSVSDKVGDYPNVRVYADNRLVGRTGRNGTLVVPRLRPFERNNLRIKLADLPWDAQAPGDQLAVRPYNRHGIAVDFNVRPARAGSFGLCSPTA